jgi:hypothetical protein
MPTNVPVPPHSAGDIFTASMWTDYIQANINKLLNTGHRVLTVAAFLALTGLEDGDEAYVEVDSANGIQWHLRYHLASTKWRFLGGPELAAEVATSESNTTNGYAALATAGPVVTVPLNGDYDVHLGATITGQATELTPKMSFDIGGTGAVDADAIFASSAAGTTVLMSVFRTMTKAALTATTALTAKYGGSSANTKTFSRRRLAISPRRIG